MLADYVLSHGNKSIASSEEFIHEIQKTARNTYRLNKKTDDMVSVAMAMTVENIRFLENKCK